MSFNYHARKIRNSQLPLTKRRSRLSSCIMHLSWLTNRHFQEVRQSYVRNYSLDSPEGPTESQLLAALDAIEVERNLYLEKLRAFERKRIREKMKGQRHLRKGDIKALHAN